VSAPSDSPLTSAIRGFVAAKRALGRKFLNEEKALHLFDRFVAERGRHRPEDVAPVDVEEFLVSRHRAPARSHNHLLGVVRRFFGWLVGQGALAASPVVGTRPRRETARSLPYLFSSDQIRALLAAAARLPDTPYSPRRGATYRMAFALLYALGLRVGEASRLCMGDVDLGRELLVIRGTKFGKTRLVPFGPRLGAEIRAHVTFRRTATLDPEAPLLSLDGRRPLGTSYICAIFSKIARGVVSVVPAGVRRPHPHCLRHSFAVATLLRWYREGLDPQQRLPHLATFLGHVSPSSTAVYLTITPDLIEEAHRRFETFAAQVVEEVQR
jgi:site-specific recombinase XerD